MKKSPYEIQLEAGKTYYWCTCGLSLNQPFCDGAHKGIGKKSLHFTEPTSQTRYLCGCKQTKNPPYCDGSHNQ
jgi:CDGSH-type Zn-finger protein